MNKRESTRTNSRPPISVAVVLLAAVIFAFPASRSLAADGGHSIITIGEGTAALGNDKTRDQTESDALALAASNAAEKAAAHVQSAPEMENFTLKTDLVKAYAEAGVTVLEKLESAWVKDPQLGESFRAVIRAEVRPNLETLISSGPAAKPWADDPTAPLTVSLTSPKQDYKAGEHVTFVLKGNKPFFARVVYEDSQGTMIQLLPDPYRTENYFEGGLIHRLPSGQDQSSLTVVPPFGEERVTVYASTRPLGQVALKRERTIYLVEETRTNLAARTRNIKLQGVQPGKAAGAVEAAEFYEASLMIRTGPSVR